MSWTATTLLQALGQTGTPEHTIEAGHKFVRLMKDDTPEGLLGHLRELKITQGTLDKAQELLSGKKKVEDYRGTPPAAVLENQHLAKSLAQEAMRIMQEMTERQMEKQAAAAAAGIGNPTEQKEQLTSGKRR